MEVKSDIKLAEAQKFIKLIIDNKLNQNFILVQNGITQMKVIMEQLVKITWVQNASEDQEKKLPERQVIIHKQLLYDITEHTETKMDNFKRKMGHLIENSTKQLTS